MSDAAIGVVGTIIGTIVGFILSETATFLRTRSAGKKQIAAIKATLVPEMDLNLGMIDAFIDIFSAINPQDLTDEQQRAILSMFSHWKEEVWKTQLSTLPQILSTDEVYQVNSFYYELQQITAKAQMPGHDLVKTINTIKDTAKSLVEKGNPLQI